MLTNVVEQRNLLGESLVAVRVLTRHANGFLVERAGLDMYLGRVEAGEHL